MSDLMKRVVAFVDSTEYEDLSNDVIEYAKKHIMDTIGIIIAGTSAEGIREVVELSHEWGGIAESTIPVFGYKVPSTSAAFAIGPMARAWDFGGVHPDANEHTSEYVLPAALPIAEKLGSSGKDLILAVALGNEVISRIGASVHTITGVSMAKTYSVFKIWGAVAAVGKLMNLNSSELMNAMGLAYTQGGCDNQMFVDGVLKIRLQHAFVADSAIKSCLLAKKGLTGTRNILEGEKGFYSAFFPRNDKKWVLEGLDEKHFIAPRTIIKGYPTCTYTHSAIETTLSCVVENNILPDDVEKVIIGVNTPTYRLVVLPKETRYHPQNPADAQFSIPYTTACAIVNRRVFLDDFSFKALERKSVNSMMEKIYVEVDPEIESTDPVGFAGAKVAIETKEGNQFTKRIDHVKGTPENPMQWIDVQNKFASCLPFAAYPMSEEKTTKLAKYLRALETVTSISTIIENLSK